MCSECPLCGAVTANSYCNCDSEDNGKYTIIWRNWSCTRNCCVTLYDTFDQALGAVYTRNHPGGPHQKNEWMIAYIDDSLMDGVKLCLGGPEADLVSDKLKASVAVWANATDGWNSHVLAIEL